jgi:hypothetical protein
MQITDIITSQNLLFDLVEREADRNTFKHDPRVERPFASGPLFFNQVELTVKAPPGLTLDFEGNRPGTNPILEDQCTIMVGVFRKERHKLATPLEDHKFLPKATAHGAVSWQEGDGPSYTPHQLCDFAFERLRKHAPRC